MMADLRLMSNIMIDLEKIALQVFNGMFSDDPRIIIDGTDYAVYRLPRSGLRSVSIGGYEFIEQNPKKDSQWAKKAREGHLIMWVFHGRQYVAQVIDGSYRRLGKRTF